MKSQYKVLLLSLGFGFLGFLSSAQNSQKNMPRRATIPKAATNRSAAPAERKSTNSAGSSRALSEALAMVKNGQYDKAAPLLYNLSRKTEFENDRMKIKYVLGQCLMELKLYQVAAFQFVDIIRNGSSKYTKAAIEKLSFAADHLGDDTLLNYAISKVQLNEFPAQSRDMIYFRLGEIKLKNAQNNEAQELFGKVENGSRYFAQAKYNRGLAFLEANQAGLALPIFKELYDSRSSASVVDRNKVAAQMGIARTYYQAQKWDEAIEAYRAIPRDTEYWHDALFESTWAMLRAAKFRSALSNFQSLHSTYYEDHYLPESLLLRAIVFLYICKYDEMGKVLGLFEKTYGPVRANLGQFIKSNTDPIEYFNEIDKANSIRKDKKIAGTLKIPYSAARNILNEGNVKRSLNYLKALGIEKNKLDSISSLNRTPLAAYAMKVLANRAKNSKISVGEMVKAHMVTIRAELRDLYEQVGFIRYEMINGQKELLKKRIAGKSLEQVDDQVDREFYVQNGYEYWPFEGEYWLDEIGNYHYLGKQSCE